MTDSTLPSQPRGGFNTPPRMSIKDRRFYQAAVSAALAAPRGWREDRILATLRIVHEDTCYPGCAILTGRDEMTAIIHLERKEFVG